MKLFRYFLLHLLRVFRNIWSSYVTQYIYIYIHINVSVYVYVTISPIERRKILTLLQG